MMGIGVITKAQDWPSSDKPASYVQGYLDGAGYEPGITPVLHRLGVTQLSVTEDRLTWLPGTALYLTTQDDPADVLAGKYDDELARLEEAITPDTLVRILHEADAEYSKKFPAHWTRWEPKTWADVFTYVADKVGGRSWACFIHHKNGELDNADYWVPYLDLIEPDVVGFDIYARDTLRWDGKPVNLADRAQPWVDWLHDYVGGHMSDRVVLGEVGVIAGPKRRRVLASLRELEGVEGIVIYDLHEFTLGVKARRDVAGWMK